MDTYNRIVIFFKRENAGVCNDQHNYSGKKYIYDKVRLISELYRLF
jgi:hypothetical protein